MTLGKTAEWVPVPGCISALNDCLGGRDNDQVLGATSVQERLELLLQLRECQVTVTGAGLLRIVISMILLPRKRALATAIKRRWQPVQDINSKTSLEG